MTNNEVDVAKCEQYMTDFKQPNNIEGGYYTHHNICECGTQGVENFNFFCKDNPNCYYKQLQRKTAECEKLNEELKCKHLVLDECSQTGKNCKGLRACFEQLERKNEKLKEELENAKYSSKMWQEQADKRNEISKIWFKKAAKYKSALEEIEKFCYRGVGNCDGNETECNISLILDFINKVKEQK